MTRRQANGYHLLVTNRRDFLDDHPTNKQNMLIRKIDSMERYDRFAAMTCQKKYTALKNMASDLDGRQRWQDMVFKS